MSPQRQISSTSCQVIKKMQTFANLTSSSKSVFGNFKERETEEAYWEKSWKLRFRGFEDEAVTGAGLEDDRSTSCRGEEEGDGRGELPISLHKASRSSECMWKQKEELKNEVRKKWLMKERDEGWIWGKPNHHVLKLIQTLRKTQQREATPQKIALSTRHACG